MESVESDFSEIRSETTEEDSQNATRSPEQEPPEGDSSSPHNTEPDIELKSADNVNDPVVDSANQDEEFYLEQLLAEADRQYEGVDDVIETETETNLEPTKYTRAITKIQKFDTKLRVLSMRDKALKRHSKAMNSLLASGQVEEAEYLALQVPGNERLDEECTELDGIFHQTELNSLQTDKQVHFPRINTQINMVGVETEIISKDLEDLKLSDFDVKRLEEILENDTCDSLVTSESIGMLEIDTNLELMGVIPEPTLPDQPVSSDTSSVEDILTRDQILNPFNSKNDNNLRRIDTALELITSQSTHDNLAISESVEAILSQINSES